MVQAFSQLKRVLGERRLSVPQLQRRLEEHGLTVNLKSLYRLAKDDQPLERLNLRVAGMICQVCDVPLPRLIAFELAENRLRRLSTAKQKRLDALMDKNNEGLLTSAERKELNTLVRDAEEIGLSNARKLAGQRRSRIRWAFAASLRGNHEAMCPGDARFLAGNSLLDLLRHGKEPGFSDTHVLGAGISRSSCQYWSVLCTSLLASAVPVSRTLTLAAGHGENDVE